MTEKGVKRKLAAILSADVKGYSRLMGEDELGTVNLLKEYRQVMANHIQRCGGRVVDAPGDNILAEFSSVVDALKCAVEVQKELKKRNDTLTAEKKMEFRIGVNLGDIIEDGNRIYGDGVNVAARIEGLADAGGVCVSGTAYDQIGKKLPFGYEYLGEQTVKNIEKPVRVYRVLTDPDAAGKVIGEKRFLGRISRRAAMVAVIAFIIIAGGLVGWNIYLHQSRKVEAADPEKMAYPLPDKPSIAVLPFANMTGDPNQDFISDGFTQQIITSLSMHPQLFVIASSTVFTYKGKPVKIQQVAEELGVQYVLEGSIQSQENLLRLTVQLIDTLGGKTLWSERYDGDRKDIFELQDEITIKILEELHVELVAGEHFRKVAGSPKSLDFMHKMMKAYSYFLLGGPENIEQAQRAYEEALTLEPEDAIANNGLAWTYFLSVPMGFSKSPQEDMAKANRLAKKAIALNDSYGEPHTLLGYFYLIEREYEKAVAEMEKAVALSPNSAIALSGLADNFKFIGKREEAISLANQAIRLNPLSQTNLYKILGEVHCLAGQYEEAIDAFKKSLHLNPNYGQSKLHLAVAYSLSGREEEARSLAEEFLTINPRFSVKRFEKMQPYKNQADIALLVDAMRKAGLPD